MSNHSYNAWFLMGLKEEREEKEKEVSYVML